MKYKTGNSENLALQVVNYFILNKIENIAMFAGAYFNLKTAKSVAQMKQQHHRKLAQQILRLARKTQGNRK